MKLPLFQTTSYAVPFHKMFKIEKKYTVILINSIIRDLHMRLMPWICRQGRRAVQDNQQPAGSHPPPTPSDTEL